MVNGYFNKIIEFWKPQLESGMIFAYLTYLVIGIAGGLIIYQILSWIFERKSKHEKEK